MADRIKLDFESRSVTGKKVGQLRRQGLLPATVYGKGVGPFNVQINARTFSDLYKQAGKTSLLDITIPGQKAQSAFIHSVQRHPVTRAILHADFLAVDLLVEVTVDVPVHVVGESPLVARGDAILNQPLNALSVRALPTDLPSNIEVDISSLDSMDKTIHVRDIPALASGTITTPEDELVISLTPARVVEAEEVAAEEEVEAAEPELVREEREEEEEE
jgi:large subunit ribosomal protein L25